MTLLLSGVFLYVCVLTLAVCTFAMQRPVLLIVFSILLMLHSESIKTPFIKKFFFQVRHVDIEENFKVVQIGTRKRMS